MMITTKGNLDCCVSFPYKPGNSKIEFTIKITDKFIIMIASETIKIYRTANHFLK